MKIEDKLGIQAFIESFKHKFSENLDLCFIILETLWRIDFSSAVSLIQWILPIISEQSRLENKNSFKRQRIAQFILDHLKENFSNELLEAAFLLFRENPTFQNYEFTTIYCKSNQHYHTLSQLVETATTKHMITISDKLKILKHLGYTFLFLLDF